MTKRLPVSTDPCGLFRYGTPNSENDYMTIGRLDYQRSAGHSIFGRYLLDHTFTPPAYDKDHNTLNAIELGKTGMAQAFTIGDTYLIGSNIVNSFHFTANRTAAAKTEADLTNAGIGPADREAAFGKSLRGTNRQAQGLFSRPASSAANPCDP